MRWPWQPLFDMRLSMRSGDVVWLRDLTEYKVVSRGPDLTHISWTKHRSSNESTHHVDLTQVAGVQTVRH